MATGPESKAQRVRIYYRTLGSSGAKSNDQQQAAVYLSLKGKRRYLDLLTPFDTTLTPPGTQDGATEGKETGLDMRDLQACANPCNA
jgi:hypothetical protein